MFIFGESGFDGEPDDAYDLWTEFLKLDTTRRYVFLYLLYSSNDFPFEYIFYFMDGRIYSILGSGHNVFSMIMLSYCGELEEETGENLADALYFMLFLTDYDVVIKFLIENDDGGDDFIETVLFFLNMIKTNIANSLKASVAQMTGDERAAFDELFGGHYGTLTE